MSCAEAPLCMRTQECDQIASREILSSADSVSMETSKFFRWKERSLGRKASGLATKARKSSSFLVGFFHGRTPVTVTNKVTPNDHTSVAAISCVLSTEPWTISGAKYTADPDEKPVVASLRSRKKSHSRMVPSSFNNTFSGLKIGRASCREGVCQYV